jgi:hypothetical protein
VVSAAAKAAQPETFSVREKPEISPAADMDDSMRKDLFRGEMSMVRRFFQNIPSPIISTKRLSGPESSL